MQIVTPGIFINENDIGYEKLFYLAGQDTGWQDEALGIIEGSWPKAVVMVPFEYGPERLFFAHVIEEDKALSSEQYCWASHYLGMVKRLGCVVYWLPSESQQDPDLDQAVLVEAISQEIEALIIRDRYLSPRIAIGVEGEILGKEIA